VSNSLRVGALNIVVLYSIALTLPNIRLRFCIRNVSKGIPSIDASSLTVVSLDTLAAILSEGSYLSIIVVNNILNTMTIELRRCRYHPPAPRRAATSFVKVFLTPCRRDYITILCVHLSRIISISI